MRDKDVALEAIRKRGCDVILSIAVIDVKSGNLLCFRL